MKFRIVHFSDIHLSAPLKDVAGFFDKRIVGTVNARIVRKHLHDPEIMPAAVESMLAQNPDLIVFSGDAASCGQPPEFELAAKILQPLTDSGIPILYTPGNHDLYVKSRKCRSACETFITHLTNGKMSLDRYPAAFDAGPLKLLVFNGARPTNPLLSCGFFDEKSQMLLREEVEHKEKPLVAICHFPVRRIRKGLVNGLRHQMFHTGEAVEFLNSGKLDLVLCGHIHKPYFDLDGSGRGETSCGSLTRFRAYSVIDFDGTQFLHRRVEL